MKFETNWFIKNQDGDYNSWFIL